MVELRVKRLWWEGPNLTVLTTDDRQMTFTDCYPIAPAMEDAEADETTGLVEIQVTFRFDSKSQQ
jgi:hypothetical protein